MIAAQSLYYGFESIRSRLLAGTANDDTLYQRYAYGIIIAAQSFSLI